MSHAQVKIGWKDSKQFYFCRCTRWREIKQLTLNKIDSIYISDKSSEYVSVMAKCMF